MLMKSIVKPKPETSQPFDDIRLTATCATLNYLGPLFQNPYMVNIILVGCDEQTGPSLFYIDYIASLIKTDKATFSYGSYFALSMMDRHYHKDMTVEGAIALVDKCIIEIQSRLVVAPPNFIIKIVDKDGAREYAWREFIRDTPVHAT